jgi:Protein of unknown function (DUF2795)
VDIAEAAELKTTLQGIALPAEKAALLEYAVRQRAEPQLLDALQSLPEREYESLDDVAEQLVHVQPPRDLSEPTQPKEESGQPPGGNADYVTPSPSDTGQVPDLDQAEE